MATSSSNVVAFDSIQKRDGIRRPGDIQMINECRSLVADHLNRLLQGLFLRTDDELFKLSDKAESSTVQTMYFDAMRYVRKEKENLLNLCIQAFNEQYDDYWQSAKRGRIQQPQREQPPAGLDDFALVENETLEEDLAINSMIQKGVSLFHSELFGLGKRFGVLRNGSEEAPEEIPVDPAALCHSFEKAIKPQTIELKVKLLIYKLFDGLVLSQCGPMYQDLNAYLAGQGILPTIARSSRRGTSTSYPSGEAGYASEPEGAEAAYMEAFQSMQSLLDGWRSHLGLPSQAANLPPGAVYVNAGEVINALSLLQQPNLLPANLGGEGEASGDVLKAYLLSQLSKLSPDGQSRAVGRSEEDIIDMVAMVFDFILDDRNLCDPIKALIARLQIPIVKVAILDKSFFAKKNHPARVLLNQLAQAGVGLDIADSSSENPIFRKIEEVVGRILHDFDQDIGFVTALLEDFTAFLEKDVQRSQLAEDRTRQTTQSKEQLNLAKRKVAYEISVRLTGKNIPTAAQSFLFNAWKDVLVLAYLRRERDPTDWKNALATMDQLIRSVIPPVDASGRQDLVQTIPPMLRTIRDSLEAISFDPHQTEELLKDLESCHLVCLRVTPGVEHVQKEQSEVTIKDPDLAEAIREVRCNLPDIDDISVEEMELNGMAEEIVLESLQPKSGIGVDTFFERASAMRVGEWIEFTDEYKNASRAKLSWKSQVTGLYVFVNRKGVKVAEMKVNDLATRLRLGAANIIEGTTVPLMDRALSALMQTLKTPAQQAQPAA